MKTFSLDMQFVFRRTSSVPSLFGSKMCVIDSCTSVGLIRLSPQGLVHLGFLEASFQAAVLVLGEV